MNKLYFIDKKRREKGALFFLKVKLYKFYEEEKIPQCGEVAAKIIEDIEEIFIGKLELIKGDMSGFFQQISSFVFKQLSPQGESYQTISLKIEKDFQNIELWLTLIQQLKTLSKKVRLYIGELRKLIERIRGLSYKLPNHLLSLSAVVEKIESLFDSLEYILLSSNEQGIVRWIEIASKKRIVRLKASPLDVSAQIRENIFCRFLTVILTSATLAVDNQFTYLKKRTGLDQMQGFQVAEKIIPSGFDFQKQVFLAIPLDISEPGEKDYYSKAFSGILEVLKATHGRAFVLFTSFHALNQAYAYLQKPLLELGISLFKQGESGNHYLLKKFKSNKDSVLLGTNSFWEGVDVAGESLQCVILARLPFYVPTDPLVEERVNFIKMKGGNPFMEYVVPQAVIRFKQGFGRLIRNKTDKGTVVVFDKRVKSRHYGKIFLNSLPKCTVSQGNSAELLREIRDFLL